MEFRKRLATQLMTHSSSSKHISLIDEFGVRTNLQNHIIISTNACNGVCVILSQIAKECKTCITQGRTAQASEKRMIMQELSVNSVRIKGDEEKIRKSRSPRTKYDYSICQIHLCQGRRGMLLGRAYSVNNQGLRDSYVQSTVPIKI